MSSFARRLDWLAGWLGLAGYVGSRPLLGKSNRTFRAAAPCRSRVHAHGYAGRFDVVARCARLFFFLSFFLSLCRVRVR